MAKATYAVHVGDVFGRLTVLDPTLRLPPAPSQVRNGAPGHRAALCECTCGSRITVALHNLLRPHGTISCGCAKAERIVAVARAHAKHGLSDHWLYQTWSQMVDRCTKPATHNYRWYGARGITVHPEWLDSPEGFIRYCEQTLGPRPSGHSLDRIDNDRGYKPGNLRWADQSTQVRNSRTSRKTRGAIDVPRMLPDVG